MNLRLSHQDVLRNLVEESYVPGTVIVEVGCGNSTLGICAALPDDGQWRFYSIDNDATKLRAVAQTLGRAEGPDRHLELIAADSIPALKKVARECSKIDLLFLDGMGNALRCFREFAQVEAAIRHEGARILIDNAVRSHEYNPMARKGRVLMPYLEAHPRWALEEHPDWGDFMVLATRRNKSGNQMPEEFGIHPEDWEKTLEEELRNGGSGPA